MSYTTDFSLGGGGGGGSIVREGEGGRRRGEGGEGEGGEGGVTTMSYTPDFSPVRWEGRDIDRGGRERGGTEGGREEWGGRVHTVTCQ